MWGHYTQPTDPEPPVMKECPECGGYGGCGPDCSAACCPACWMCNGTGEVPRDLV
jgi:hypothetical protein